MNFIEENLFNKAKYLVVTVVVGSLIG